MRVGKEEIQSSRFLRREFLKIMIVLAASALPSWACAPTATLVTPDKNPSIEDYRGKVRDVFLDSGLIKRYMGKLMDISSGLNEGTFSTDRNVVEFQIKRLEANDSSVLTDNIEIYFNSIKDRFGVIIRTNLDKLDDLECKGEHEVAYKALGQAVAIREAVYIIHILKIVADITESIFPLRDGFDGMKTFFPQLVGMIAEQGNRNFHAKEFLPAFLMTLALKYKLGVEGKQLVLARAGLKDGELQEDLEEYVVPIYVYPDVTESDGYRRHGIISFPEIIPLLAHGLGGVFIDTRRSLVSILKSAMDLEGLGDMFEYYSKEVIGHGLFPSSDAYPACDYPKIRQIEEVIKASAIEKVLSLLDKGGSEDLGSLHKLDQDLNYPIVNETETYDTEKRVISPDNKYAIAVYRDGEVIFFVAHNYNKGGKFIGSLREGDNLIWIVDDQKFKITISKKRNVEVSEDMNETRELMNKLKGKDLDSCKVVLMTCGSGKRIYIDGKEFPPSYVVMEATLEYEESEVVLK